jgi:hypothetical protein
MKYSRRLMVALLTFIVGLLAAAGWSAHLGRRVWSPRVFAWRNFLRRTPKIENRPGCPLTITNPRHYSFMSIGSTIGSVLRFDVVNRSDKPVDSYECRHYSLDPVVAGSFGSRPEAGVMPGEMTEGSVSVERDLELTLTIDFVQFADGTTWFSNLPEAPAKPLGVEAGARAAAQFLLKIFERDGAVAVVETLPRIHLYVHDDFSRINNPDFGIFGFYCGVTNMEVRVRRAFEEGGPERVESVLRSFAK